MDIIRTYKFRLKPNAAQEAELTAACAAVRMIYNAANEQRLMYGRKQGTDPHGRNSFFNSNRQNKELGYRSCKTLRGEELVEYPGLASDPELAWITEALPADCFGAALRNDLDKAWDDFFKNVKAKKPCNTPSFRNANDDNSLSFKPYKSKQTNVVFGEKFVKLPKFGYIKYVKHARLRRLKLGVVTVVKEGARWYICVVTTRTVAEKSRDVSIAGIDLGTRRPVTVSDSFGESWVPVSAEGLRTSGKLSKRQKALQREISRGKKGSKRRRNKVARLAAMARKEAARKRLGLHAITTDLAREYSHIGIENLSVKKMTESGKTRRKQGKAKASNAVQAAYNRAFLDVPKYMFRTQLEYKVAGYGGHTVAVDPAYTSQTCKACGNVSAHSRTSQSHYQCTACGHEEDADGMAAFNILNKAFPNHRMMVGGSGSVVEPRKTPSKFNALRNSDNCKPSDLVQKQTAASSNSMGSPVEGRNDTNFTLYEKDEPVTNSTTCEDIRCGTR